ATVTGCSPAANFNVPRALPVVRFPGSGKLTPDFGIDSVNVELEVSPNCVWVWVCRSPMSRYGLPLPIGEVNTRFWPSSANENVPVPETLIVPRAAVPCSENCPDAFRGADDTLVATAAHARSASTPVPRARREG